jgi:hypothetical protein
VFFYLTLMKHTTHLYRSSRTAFGAIGVGVCEDLSG